MDYKKMIVEMLEQIKDEKFLKRIYISIQEYLKEKKSE